VLSGGEAGWLDGGKGDDLVFGGAGDDVIEGGAHRAVQEGTDDDSLYGGGGDDTMRGGQGADLLDGGDGDDVLDHHGRAEERLKAEIHRFDWHEDDAADTLDGGAGDDVLIFGSGDTASGGSGADIFRLYAGEDGAPAEILDFAVGEDFLRVTLDPEEFSAVPPFEVRASINGMDGEVVVDGTIIAYLRGAATASVADLYVEVKADIYA
jgi:hypothetical protein